MAIPFALRKARLKFLCWLKRRTFKKEFYDKEYFELEAKGWEIWPRDSKLLLNKAVNFFEGKTVLDAGCGNAKTMEIIKKKGFSVEGFEVSQHAVDYCKNLGFNVWREDAEKMDYDSKWDTVFLSHVLEHVLDDYGLLKRALKACKKCVVLVIPEHSFKPDHLHYYSSGDIIKMIEKLKKKGLASGHEFEHVKDVHLPSFVVRISKAGKS